MTILGIDLGTTNPLVAVLRDGVPETLPNELGEHLKELDRDAAALRQLLVPADAARRSRAGPSPTASGSRDCCGDRPMRPTPRTSRRRC